MKAAVHPSLATQRALAHALDCLEYQFTSENLRPEVATTLCLQIQELLAQAYQNQWQGVIRTAISRTSALYHEVAISSPLIFDYEGAQPVMELMAQTLPTPDLKALRFYLQTGKAAIEASVKSFIANNVIHENFTIKSDAYFILKTMAEQGESHVEAALELAEFLSEVSDANPQIMGAADLVHSLAGYYGGLETFFLAPEHNERFGQLINPRWQAAVATRFAFSKPTVEDAIGLLDNGFVAFSEALMPIVFPKNYKLKGKTLRMVEAATDFDLAPLVEKIINSADSRVLGSDKVEHLEMLTTYYLCSDNETVKQSHLDFNLAGVQEWFPGCLSRLLQENSPTFNEERALALTDYALMMYPGMIKGLKADPVTRDLVKKIPTLSVEILEEDLGL